jgi:hypothetical protein
MVNSQIPDINKYLFYKFGSATKYKTSSSNIKVEPIEGFSEI